MKVVRLNANRGTTLGLALAVVAVALAHLLRKLAEQDGYDVDPHSADVHALEADGLLAMMFFVNILIAVLVAKQSKDFRLLRLLVCAFAMVLCIHSCFAGLDPSGPTGWTQFQKRMQEDIRPRDLELWLRNAAATNPAANLVIRNLTRDEFAAFGPTNASYAPPRLVILESKITSIEWGDDLMTYAIELENQTNFTVGRWQGHLYFGYGGK